MTTRHGLQSFAAALALALLVSAPAGAVAPPDREVTGGFQSWQPSLHAVTVDGRRYAVAPGVTHALGPNRTHLRPQDIRPGRTVTLHLMDGTVHRVLVHGEEAQ